MTPQRWAVAYCLCGLALWGSVFRMERGSDGLRLMALPAFMLLWPLIVTAAWL